MWCLWFASIIVQTSYYQFISKNDCSKRAAKFNLCIFPAIWTFYNIPGELWTLLQKFSNHKHILDTEIILIQWSMSNLVSLKLLHFAGQIFICCWISSMHRELIIHILWGMQLSICYICCLQNIFWYKNKPSNFLSSMECNISLTSFLNTALGLKIIRIMCTTVHFSINMRFIYNPTPTRKQHVCYT